MLINELSKSYGIFESFNRGLPIRWEDASNDDMTLFHASFVINDGIFVVRFKYVHYNPIWEISFTRNNVLDLTQTKSAFIVLATVMKAIREFIKQVEPMRIEFAAANDEISRAKLYPKLMALIQKEFPQYTARSPKTMSPRPDKRTYIIYYLERPRPEWVPPPAPPKPDYTNDPPMTDEEWAEMERSLRETRLNEMPVSVQLIGDHEPGTFRDDDITLATNPKARAKVERIWHNSVADVDVYIINKAGDMRYRDDDLLDTHLEKTAGQYQAGRANRLFNTNIVPRKNAITVILSQNEGDDRVPLTGWMLAHRLFHAFQYSAIRKSMRNNVNMAIQQLVKNIDGTRFDIQNRVNKIYHVHGWPAHQQSGIAAYFIDLIGTTRAARSGKLSAAGEIIPEAFAQFMLQGKVRFNPAPKDIPVSYYHQKGVAVLHDPNQWQSINDDMQKWAWELQDDFTKIIKLAMGRVFVL